MPGYSYEYPGWRAWFKFQFSGQGPQPIRHAPGSASMGSWVVSSIRTAEDTLNFDLSYRLNFFYVGATIGRPAVLRCVFAETLGEIVAFLCPGDR